MFRTPSHLPRWLTGAILTLGAFAISFQPLAAALHGLSHAHTPAPLAERTHSHTSTSSCHHHHHDAPASDLNSDANPNHNSSHKSDHDTDHQSGHDCPICAKLATDARSILLVTAHEPARLTHTPSPRIDVAVEHVPPAPALPRSSRGPPLSA